MRPTTVVVVVTALLLGGAVQSQTIYRCGNAYSQTPCGTEAKAVQVGPSVAPERPAGALTGSVLCIAAARQFLGLTSDEAPLVTAVKAPATVIQYAGQPMAVHQFFMRAEGRPYLCFLSEDEHRVLQFVTPMQFAAEARQGSAGGGLGSLSTSSRRNPS